jgi:hypothetical protein
MRTFFIPSLMAAMAAIIGAPISASRLCASRLVRGILNTPHVWWG